MAVELVGPEIGMAPDRGAVLAAVQSFLRDSDQPRSVNQVERGLPRTVRWPRPELEELLTAEVAGGRMWAYGSASRRTYWDRAPRDLIRQQVQQRLRRGPRTRSELIGEIAGLKALGVSKAEVERVVGELLASQVIVVNPAFLGGRTKLLSLAPLTVVPYLSNVFDRLAKQLGVSPEAVLKAAADDLQSRGEASDATAVPLESPRSTPTEVPAEFPSDMPQRVIDRMCVIEPNARRGAYVSVPELRRSLDFQLSKAAFDQLLIEMSESAMVDLHKHSHAASLTTEEREELVANDMGQFFNCVSLSRHNA